MRTGWKICDCSTWRREDPKRWILGSFQYLKLSKGWVSRWWGQTLLGGAQQLNKGQRSQNGIQFHLSIRNKLITLRVMEHWRKLPRSVVASPFLEILKTSLEAFLAIYCREYFFFAGIGLDNLQRSLSYDSVIPGILFDLKEGILCFLFL